MELEERYLVQTPPKRNGDCTQTQQSGRTALFNGDCKPADQSCDLLKALALRLAPLHELRKPDQAFVITHRGYRGRHDRRDRPPTILRVVVLDVFHRIVSSNTASSKLGWRLHNERRWRMTVLRSFDGALR
jgi:hypothetical protein